MWSHYAEKHTGIVYRFNVDGVLIKGMLAQVRYENRFLKFKDVARAFRKMGADSTEFSRELFKLAYAWKAKSWSNEEEWRLFTKKAMGSYLTIPAGSMELTGIILGWKMNDDMRKKVMSFVDESRRRIVPYAAKPREGSIGLQLFAIEEGNNP